MEETILKLPTLLCLFTYTWSRRGPPFQHLRFQEILRRIERLAVSEREQRWQNVGRTAGLLYYCRMDYVRTRRTCGCCYGYVCFHYAFPFCSFPRPACIDLTLLVLDRADSEEKT